MSFSQSFPTTGSRFPFRQHATAESVAASPVLIRSAGIALVRIGGFLCMGDMSIQLVTING